MEEPGGPHSGYAINILITSASSGVESSMHFLDQRLGVFKLVDLQAFKGQRKKMQ